MRNILLYGIGIVAGCLILIFNSDAVADYGSLNKRYHAIKKYLNQSKFETPIYIHSSTSKYSLRGEVYGLIHNPDITFEQLKKAFANYKNWCDFISLHLNVKACIYQHANKQKYLTFYAGRKFYQAPEDVYQVRYRFRLVAMTKDYFNVVLNAPRGPAGTSNYLLQLEAMKVEDKILFRVISSYSSSRRSRFGTSIYLHTKGKHKVGFTVVGVDSDGKPIYVRGIKGVVERNVIRYFLAGKAFMATRKLPHDKRYKALLQYWYNETEKYHQQLYEMSKKQYLETKLRERQNQLELQKIVDQKGGDISK